MPAAVLALLFQLATYAPPQAVDHVVHLEIVQGHGSSSRDRGVFYRSGSHVRSEWSMFRSRESEYTDLASGRVVAVMRDGNGVVQQVAIGPTLFRTSRLPPTRRS